MRGQSSAAKNSQRLIVCRRNPSYCFVEVATKELADRAMADLSGADVLGRPVKLGPGVARPGRKDLYSRNAKPGSSNRDYSGPAFQRWERTDAADHWKGCAEEGRRLIVEGLPRMSDYYSVEAGVQELFRGFDV